MKCTENSVETSQVFSELSAYNFLLILGSREQNPVWSLQEFLNKHSMLTWVKL